MDSGAIGLIQATAIRAADANTHLDPQASTVLVTGKDEKVIQLEPYAQHRRRYRGKLATNVLSEFVAYVLRRGGTPKPQGFIEPESMSAAVIFNMGDVTVPGHCDDLAVLTLEPTVGYKQVQRLAQVRLGQREAAEWVEDWHPYLVAYDDGGKQIHLGKVVAAIRNITIAAKNEAGAIQRTHGATRTEIETIDARGAEDGLPTFLDFTCVPFLDFAQRVFRFRVSIITSSPPQVALKLVGKEQHEEDLANEFLAKLRAGVQDAAQLTIGTFTP